MKKAAKGKSKPVGRPTICTDEVIQLICDTIASSNKGLHVHCKERKDFPARTTIYRWLDENKEFRERYARAREAQADFLADEIIEIADDSSRDSLTITKKDGTSYDIEDKEWASRSKLRVEARKWKASKLAPKKYGDKIDLTTGGKEITTPVITYLPDNGRGPVSS